MLWPQHHFLNANYTHFSVFNSGIVFRRTARCPHVIWLYLFIKSTNEREHIWGARGKTLGYIVASAIKDRIRLAARAGRSPAETPGWASCPRDASTCLVRSICRSHRARWQGHCPRLQPWAALAKENCCCLWEEQALGVFKKAVGLPPTEDPIGLKVPRKDKREPGRACKPRFWISSTKKPSRSPTRVQVLLNAAWLGLPAGFKGLQSMYGPALVLSICVPLVFRDAENPDSLTSRSSRCWGGRERGGGVRCWGGCSWHSVRMNRLGSRAAPWVLTPRQWTGWWDCLEPCSRDAGFPTCRLLQPNSTTDQPRAELENEDSCDTVLAFSLRKQKSGFNSRKLGSGSRKNSGFLWVPGYLSADSRLIIAPPTGANLIALAQFWPWLGKVENPRNCHSPKILVLPSNSSSTLNSPLSSKPPYLSPSWSKAILSITLVMIHREPILHGSGWILLPSPGGTRGPGLWTVRALRQESLKLRTTPRLKKGVLGPPLPNPSYYLLGAPNVQAFTINLQRQYYRLSFFLLFSFFSGKSETWVI